MRPLNAFFSQRQGEFANEPEALLASLWAAEYKETGKRLDDDVSIIWFRMAEQAKAELAAQPATHKDGVA